MKERILYIQLHPKATTEQLRKSVWGEHFTTHTILLRENDKVSLFEDADLFSDMHAFDYQNTIDGGVPIVRHNYSPPKDNVRSISVSSYSKYEWWNYPIKQLLEHPIIQELVPEKDIRSDYAGAIDHLDRRHIFSEPGMGSIWTAPEMRPGYARMYGLGFGWKAFYPQNSETKNHTVLLKENIINTGSKNDQIGS